MITISSFVKGVFTLNYVVLQDVNEGLWKNFSVRLAVVLCLVSVKALQEQHRYSKIHFVGNMIFCCLTDNLYASRIGLEATNKAFAE